jgi:hypothetical protein
MGLGNLIGCSCCLKLEKKWTEDDPTQPDPTDIPGKTISDENIYKSYGGGSFTHCRSLALAYLFDGKSWKSQSKALFCAHN